MLAQNLLKDGQYTPAEINSISQNYLKTGQFDSPTARGRILGPEDGLQADPDLPQRSTLEPIRTLKKREQLYAMDKSSGLFTDMSGNPVANIPPDVDPKVQTYNEPKEPLPRTGHAWKIDQATGQRQDMGPNNDVKDTYVYWNSKTGQGGGGGKSPDVMLMEDTVKKYQDAKKTGKPMTQDFIDSAKTAFDGLSIPFEEADLPPSGFDKVRNTVSKATGGFVAPAPVQKGDPVVNFDKSGAVKKNRAMDWLKQHGQPVTDANIAAVIKAGKVQ